MKTEVIVPTGFIRKAVDYAADCKCLDEHYRTQINEERNQRKICSDKIENALAIRLSEIREKNWTALCAVTEIEKVYENTSGCCDGSSGPEALTAALNAIKKFGWNDEKKCQFSSDM